MKKTLCCLVAVVLFALGTVVGAQRDPLKVTPAWRFNLMLAVLVSRGHTFTLQEREIIENFAAETWPTDCDLDTFKDPHSHTPEAHPKHYLIAGGGERHVCTATVKQ
jgi:hypothetical protein